MRGAAISTPQLASQFQRGTYHMVIAPWVTTFTEYATYYRDATRPENTLVMLDSGSWEGDPVFGENLYRIAKLVRADEVCLPDVLRQGKATLLASRDALDHLTKQDGTPEGTWRITSVMFIPQGSNLFEWKSCRDTWCNWWETQDYRAILGLTLGVISYRQYDRASPPNVHARTGVLGETCNMGYPVHMLGIPDLGAFCTHELQAAVKFGVRGVDSSIAFALGAKGRLLTPVSEKVDLGKPTNYASLGYGVWPLIRLNVAIWKYWIGAGRASETIPTELIRRIAGREVADRRVYENLQFALRACRVPPGPYAVGYDQRLPVYVRPLGKEEQVNRHESRADVAYT